MRVDIFDMHDSHGAVFTLTLTSEDGNPSDAEVFKNLNRLLHWIAGEGKGKFVLYSYGNVELTPTRLVLPLTEGGKTIARFDYLQNSYREDQKFVAVQIEDDVRNHPDGMVVPHFTCTVCGKDAWGVNRDTMESYDESSRSVKPVSVHLKCKVARLREIAQTFQRNSLSTTKE